MITKASPRCNGGKARVRAARAPHTDAGGRADLRRAARWTDARTPNILQPTTNQ